MCQNKFFCKKYLKSCLCKFSRKFNLHSSAYSELYITYETLLTISFTHFFLLYILYSIHGLTLLFLAELLFEQAT